MSDSLLLYGHARTHVVTFSRVVVTETSIFTLPGIKLHKDPGLKSASAGLSGECLVHALNSDVTNECVTSR